MAGGVPEVMLHLRDLGLLDLTVKTVTGQTLDQVLDWWKGSARRAAMREMLVRKDGINPDQVIYSPEAARKAGLTSTVVFPTGNLAPEGSVIKATAIDPKMVGPDGFYRHTGPARVFVTERAAIEAVKNGAVKAGDTLVLICRGPLGSGMEETYQIVGIDEANAQEGRISWISPLARALLKAREGDTVRFDSPGGLRELDVIEVRYE